MEKVEEGAVETDEAFHWRNRKKKKKHVITDFLAEVRNGYVQTIN